jgi:RNA polymerase sigma-70 factor, ECF subfamily
MHVVVGHVRGLRRYARSLTLDAETANDVLGQTSLLAMERCGSFRGEAPRRLWLFSILHQLFASDRRRARAGLPEAPVRGAALKAIGGNHV